MFKYKFIGSYPTVFNIEGKATILNKDDVFSSEAAIVHAFVVTVENKADKTAKKEAVEAPAEEVATVEVATNNSTSEENKETNND